MLGLAALGNLLQSYSEGIRYVCGIAAGLLLILILLKLILFPAAIKEDMKNPIMASVSGTFSMALMLLSTYVKPLIGPAAYYIWLFAIALHVVLIIYFTVKFIAKLQMPKVFASYYIVYVGIAVAAITAPAYEKLSIGSAAFWFGFVSLLVLLVLVTIRYEILRNAYGNVCIGKCIVCVCSCESDRVFQAPVFPKLCVIHLPVCYQCDRFQTDNGMPCQHGTSDPGA